MEQVNRNGNVVALIHYVFQTEPERIACMPNMTEFHETAYHPNYQRTSAAAAVTCPACKRSDAYRRLSQVAGGINLPVEEANTTRG